MQKATKKALVISGMLLLLTKTVMAANPFTPDSQPTGWLSTPDVSFFNVATGTEVFYQLNFYKDTWSGDVIALDVNNVARIQATGPWDDLNPTLATAATKLENADYSLGRVIATGGVPFRWANLSGDQRAAIGSEAILNYVRGDRSNDEPTGLSLRKREYVLGDILHSNISYWDDGSSQTLFVGANDGMLHVFDATTGVENFAYVPSMLIPKLKLLSVKPYVHTHFVDGTISITNVNISKTPKTILVGGLGAGERGLFALDVTTPTASDEYDAANKVLWEITADGSYSDLGYTYGTPHIVRLNSGSAAVIAANGYMSDLGRAVLYVINANTGGLISAIDTGTGSALSPNGLSSPAVYDVDGDGKVEYAYAGDLDGQLWKFDLVANTATRLMTTSPTQAITAAPVVRPHPLGGQMVAFATGRMLSTGDVKNTDIHYVYGYWDGAPDANNRMLTQTLTQSMFNSIPVRTVTGHVPDWTTGSGHHEGWKVALSPGERVVGERLFYNNGRFYFLSTNPTIPGGENWIHELVIHTGGTPFGPIFDLNEDGAYDSLDLADNGNVPVAKYLGSGIFSQPRLVDAEGLTTTLYVYHPDLPIEDGVPTIPEDPGVSGGHFDFDIYYYGPGEDTGVFTPTNDSVTATICEKKKDVARQLEQVTNMCSENPDIGPEYTYLSDYITGSICENNKKKDRIKYYQTIRCNTVISETVNSGDYLKIKHTHEYDDKYDVTGVNMLNASKPDFNLVNALPDATTPFKVLVMNQYLNPAAFLSVGGAAYESVKTYAQLASQTNATSLLAGLTTYTRANIGTLIYNLPLDAFKNKDWWGDGGERRAGLIPTQTGCVNKVEKDGVQETPGLNDERFNGALTVQLIKPNTPPDKLELNGPDVTYGWRVKIDAFKDYVLAEYTSFWHHPNKFCYGDKDWIPDAPEDFDSDGKSEEAAAGSADPKDGAFGSGLAIINVEVTVNGNVTTTVTTYSDDTQYIRTETKNDNGTTTIHQEFRDGTEETVTTYSGRGGRAGFIDPNTGSPEEEIGVGVEGRQSWRDLFN